MILIIRVSAVVSVVLLLISCASKGKHETDQAPRQLYTDHPLVGKIWSVNDKTIVSKNELVTHILGSDYILLGETHDNLLHHQNQAWVISEIAKKHPKAVVAFEMINESQGKMLQAHQVKDTDALLHSLNKVKTNWNYEQYYRPVFDSVLTAGYDIFPANVDRKSIMNIVIKGEQSLPDNIKSLLEKNAHTESEFSIIQQEIVASHCDMLDLEAASGMVLGQRVRDAVMSLALVNNKKDKIAILIAGSQHTRKDRGVPVYIRQNDQSAKILSLAWLEVEGEVEDVNAYAKQWRAQDLPFDYVWFTPAIDRPDPCEEMRKYMKHHKK